MTTLVTVAKEVHEVHDKITELTQFVMQNRLSTAQAIQRPTILGLCTLAEVSRLDQTGRLALADQLRAAITAETTDLTMDHDGGETGNASNFEHLTCAFETAVLRAFETAGVVGMKDRMKIERRGPVIERDDDVGALMWLNGLLAQHETPMDSLSRREIILYRNNIRWRMFNQEYSSLWMREHLWRTATKTILYLERA